MKIADITKAFPSRLEGDRNAELASQKYFAEGSRYWKLHAKRIARIDAQITATAEKHIAYLSEMRAGCAKRGATKDADVYSARITEIQGASRLATINRLCNLASDDDGEVFEPMTDVELDAMNTRMAAAPEASF